MQQLVSRKTRWSGERIGPRNAASPIWEINAECSRHFITQRSDCFLHRPLYPLLHDQSPKRGYMTPRPSEVFQLREEKRAAHSSVVFTDGKLTRYTNENDWRLRAHRFHAKYRRAIVCFSAREACEQRLKR